MKVVRWPYLTGHSSCFSSHQILFCIHNNRSMLNESERCMKFLKQVFVSISYCHDWLKSPFQRPKFETLALVSVIAAPNVAMAWDLLENPNNRFDLILLDVVMPSLLGVSLLLKIMEHKSFKWIPVVSKLHLHETFLCAATQSVSSTLRNMLCSFPISGCAYFLVFTDNYIIYAHGGY